MTDYVERELERTRRRHVDEVMSELRHDDQRNDERRLLSEIDEAERRGDVRRTVELKRELSRVRGLSQV